MDSQHTFEYNMAACSPSTFIDQRLFQTHIKKLYKVSRNTAVCYALHNTCWNILYS